VTTPRLPRHAPPPAAGRIASAALRALLLLPAVGGCAAPRVAVPGVAEPPQSGASAVGTGGAVASAEPVATDAGVAVLREGGSACDAAVAVALALAVVHPQAGNLGGGGFAVVRTADRTAALDFREVAPAAARPDMFLGSDGRPRSGASWVGPLAAAVPGSPAGLFDLQRRCGRLPWPGVVRPAIRLARDGFVVTARLHDAIEEERETLGTFPDSAALFLPEGRVPAPGTTLRLPVLAATLAAYAEHGPGALASGPIGAAIETASREHGGVLTRSDLAAYRPVWREPLRFRAFGWEVATMPLPSSGGVILAESCALLERLGWSGLPRDGLERDHLLVEVWRRAYADRLALGEPETTLARADQILDPGWIATRAAGVDRRRATPSREVRPWPGRDLPPLAPAGSEPAETTHLSVVDASGAMVSLTTTLNGWFGCGLLVPGAGFLLNNEMDDFTIAPGTPNAYGLVQGDANAVRPGRRMLSSMSPLVAWRGDEAIALGSRGGSRIPTSTLQVFLDLAVDGDPLVAAVARPRFHHQWLPDVIVAETGAVPPEVRTALEGLGDTVKDATWIVGEIDAVRRRPDGGVEGAADARGPGGAAVVRQ
jgi:gamma-glutamyltranspeptidase/glutathione hydrolase